MNSFDRFRIRFRPLADRENRVRIERDRIDPDTADFPMSAKAAAAAREAAQAVRRARVAGRPVVLAFGAHAIKNGLGLLLIRLIEEQWATHLATNGAGIIHDWEFTYLGESSEDVRTNIEVGEFGIWEETGYFLNLALIVGAYEGRGYGESIGSMVEHDGLTIPSRNELMEAIGKATVPGVDPAVVEAAASAAELLATVDRFRLSAGRLRVVHPYKDYGVQRAAFANGVAFTGHPMFGHDIIYAHPMSSGAAIGRTAERDFLAYAESISRIDGGVYLSVGSAVMSPMIFEKALSMSRNVAIQEGRRIDNHSIYVVDLAESNWDWQAQGEPPADNPAYYLRYCKTFSRMGGSLTYVAADNRAFLLGMYRELRRLGPIASRV